MKTITKKDIEAFAYAIMEYLEKNGLDHDVSIYYNNKRMKHKYDWRDLEKGPELIIEGNMNPRDYFEYVNNKHILSMSFEGPLYDSINYSGYKLNGLRKIFEKYGVYWELGNSWNLSAYPICDETEFEFTAYKEPEERCRLYIWDHTKNPSKLQDIMNKWYALSQATGDHGSCVLGAGFDFTWKEIEWFMPACSPYQGSLSWEPHVDVIQKELKDIGATNIIYHWGNMD